MKQWDLLGISVSVLCAVHCIALPFFFSSLSIMGTTLLHNPWLEAALLLVSFIIGLLAFFKGCALRHKAKWPLVLFITGFALLLLNQLHEQHALYLIPAAAILMITAHYFNYRRCQPACRLSPQTKKAIE